jgi:pilus assembly protein Flp/PilA
MLKYFIYVPAYLTGLLKRDDRGATAVEYGLLVVLIALVMAVGATLLGTQLSTLFTNVANDL